MSAEEAAKKILTDPEKYNAALTYFSLDNTVK